MRLWPEGPVVVVLTCKGGVLARVVNERWIVTRCRRTRCQVDGEHSYHVWDMHTAQRTDYREDPIAVGSRPQGVNGYGIR